MVHTDILVAPGYKLGPGETVDDFYKKIPHLKSKDIADSVIYVLGAPPHVQVLYVYIKNVTRILKLKKILYCS